MGLLCGACGGLPTCRAPKWWVAGRVGLGGRWRWGGRGCTGKKRGAADGTPSRGQAAALWALNSLSDPKPIKHPPPPKKTKVAGALVEGDEDGDDGGNAGGWINVQLMLEEVGGWGVGGCLRGGMGVLAW